MLPNIGLNSINRIEPYPLCLFSVLSPLGKEESYSTRNCVCSKCIISHESISECKQNRKLMLDLVTTYRLQITVTIFNPSMDDVGPSPSLHPFKSDSFSRVSQV